MIDEARAAGDALYATKMKEHIKVDAANTLLEDAAGDSMRSDSALPDQLSGSSIANVPNELSLAVLSSDAPIWFAQPSPTFDLSILDFYECHLCLQGWFHCSSCG